MKKKVFISRKPTDCEAIQAFLPADVEIIAQPLIDTTAIPFNRSIPKTDWIFFSSSNAARHFFEQQPILSNQKIGAIGEATAKTIANFHTIDFVGDAADITDSAYRFAESIGESSVLFPGAIESMKHVQSALPAKQVVDLSVYTTTEKPAVIPPCDVYVFSSPSNVRSFAKSNPIQENPKCVAFGEATHKELLKLGFTEVRTPLSLEPHSIANTIIRYLEG
jgi:uroporphyrinogen-III synthase